MDVPGLAARLSAMTLANTQTQASMLILRKTLEVQQTSAQQLLQAIPRPPARIDPTATVGTRIDTFA